MNHLRPLLLLLVFSCLSSSASVVSDSLRDNYRFAGVNFGYGQPFRTNPYLRSLSYMPTYEAYALKFGFKSTGAHWQDQYYGMQYGGIGLYTLNINNELQMGNPLSIYLFSGGRINQLSNRLVWNYEWNLGMSFNWDPYDPFTNSDNVTLGSATNIHVALATYLGYQLTSRLTLNFGAQLTHFSNGANKLPNKGLNLCSAFLQADYMLEKPEKKLANLTVEQPPKFEKHWDVDWMAMISKKQIDYDTVGTGLSSEYFNQSYAIAGLSISPTYVANRMFKYGAAVDILYDESVGVSAFMQRNEKDGKDYLRVKYGNFWDRFSVGLAAKGELTTPYYSVIGHLGYDLIHADKTLDKLYQLIAIKRYFTDSVFGVFGIRATHFSHAQCLYFSIGYSLPVSKRR